MSKSDEMDDMIKWLREEKGCPWNEMMAVNAIQSGNVELINYLKVKGCPFSNFAVLTGYFPSRAAESK